MSLELDIKRKSEELGIEKCGIVRPEALLDYADRLRERMERIPNGEALYSKFAFFSDVRKTFPWAKSIVVAVLGYGHYALPDNGRKHFGKHYLFDSRFNPDSLERQKIDALQAYMHERGLKTESNQHPGITAMRWAAHKAGLGLIRRNNFFYTENGSWSAITAWVTDREMELTETPALKECPPGCNRCIEACPTKSLSAPYTMSMGTCVSRLLTSNDPDTYDDETNRNMGCWIYGCDTCQDACPMNTGRWKGNNPFPGLTELDEWLTPEKILSMNYEEIARLLAPKFFYIHKESFWRWKLNAINTTVNGQQRENIPLLRDALWDEQEIVRKKAEWALQKLNHQPLA